MKFKVLLLIITTVFISSFYVSAQVTAYFTVDVDTGCAPLTVYFTDMSTGPINSWSWDFDNGNTSIIQNPQMIFTSSGDYTVELTVSDGINPPDTYQRIITVFSDPQAGFSTVSADEGCAPLAVTFENTSLPGSGEITHYGWVFGDGTTSTQEDPPEHIYTNSGNYTVSLHVIDTNGCENQLLVPDYIHVTQPPVADFTADQNYSCQDTIEVQFINNSTNADSCFWDLGNSQTWSECSDPPVQNYTAGTYDISLVVFDQYGCSDSILKEDFIQVTEMAPPSFILDKDTICLGDPIPFNSTPVGQSSTWDFGDGSPLSNDFVPVHVYADTGDYTIVLIVTDITGECADTVEKTVKVEDVTAGFEMDTTYSCDTVFIVSFTDTSSTNTVIDNWLWDFGDDNTSTEQHPQHAFTDSGVFYITLIAGTPSGCTEEYTDSVIVSFPEAVIDVDPFDGGCIDSIFEFSSDNSILSSGGEPIVSYSWDFGDGNTSTEQNPQHSYSNPGEYEVILNFTNSAGCEAVPDTFIVEVGTQQTALFEIVDTACADSLLEFIDISVDSALIDEWLWDFGDGGTSTDSNAMHLYQDTTGAYEIMFVVSYNGCDSDTLKDSVFIKGPIAKLDTMYSCDKEKHFDYWFITQVIEGDSLHLDFGDGNDTAYSFTDTSRIDTIFHQYAEVGNYEAILTAWNDTNGCDNQVTTMIRVRDVLANFSISDTLPCWDQLDTLNALDINSSSQYAESYEWWIIDTNNVYTNIGSGDTLGYIFYDPGNLEIMLIVTDVNGCQDSIKYPLQVFKPFVDFYADTLIGCTPLEVQFYDSSQVVGDTVASWQWDFGDGANDSVQNPVHYYYQEILSTITLTVTDTLGCVYDTTKVEYVIATMPQVSFSASDTTVCVGDSIQFTNNTTTNNPAQDTENVLVYNWDFGDGNTSVEEEPVHAYMDTGYFHVELHATDTTLGCDSTTVDSFYIHVQEHPDVYFVADVYTHDCYNDNPLVTFYDSTDHDYINTWYWDFGNGANSDEPDSVGINYYWPDTFFVSLTLTTTYGCTGIDTIQINVLGPLAEFNFPDFACKGEPVPFTIFNTSNVGYYKWFYGDGSAVDSIPGTVDTVWYSYNSSGYKTPTLIIKSDLDGTCDVTLNVPPASDSIYVYQLTAGFNPEDSIVCVSYEMEFFDISVAEDPMSWDWDFGDGETSSDQNPVHVYQDTGVYETVLIVSANVCEDTVKKYIYVVPLPVIEASEDTVLCSGDPIQLYAVGDSNLSYYWTPVTGLNNQNIQNPIATPVESITYMVTDSYGCMATIELFVDEATVDVPSAFTPGASENNIVYVKGKDIKRLVEFKIYNRWGQLVYDSDDINEGWDGTMNGIDQNMDTYVYMVKVETHCGNVLFKKGQITLIR